MYAIQFDLSIPRYVIGLLLGKLSPRFYWSGLTCTAYKDIPEPHLPDEDWVVVKTRLGGICGTDTSIIGLTASPYLSPLGSYPFVLGHENTGSIAQVGAGVDGWQVGERVVVEPTLWCAPRGFTELCPACARGEVNHCQRQDRGKLPPGVSIGTCREVGGSWAPYFLAHRSQLYRVPDNMSDQNALMVEPFSIGLHAALQNFPADEQQVLIIGAGTIGLCTLAALRALGSQAEITVLYRHQFQGQAAEKLGASHVLRADRSRSYYEAIAGMTGGSVKRTLLGEKVLFGGMDLVFECVGTRRSLDDALRLTHNQGRVVLVSVPGVVKSIDWSPIFVHELEVRAAYLYHHAEQFQGRRWKTFDLAIDLLSRGVVDLSWLVTHRYPLEEYHQALLMTYRRGGNAAIKIAFEFGGEPVQGGVGR